MGTAAAMGPDSVIAADLLTRRFGKRRGIADVTFAVARGEVSGPNGAGKSTTILDTPRPLRIALLLRRRRQPTPTRTTLAWAAVLAGTTLVLPPQRWSPSTASTCSEQPPSIKSKPKRTATPVKCQTPCGATKSWTPPFGLFDPNSRRRRWRVAAPSLVYFAFGQEMPT
jgi:hypothetical protein